MENLTPVEIVAELDKYVHGQTMAKKMLAIALRNRYRVGMLPLIDRGSVRKQNLLLMGPTGSGKTALMRVLRNRFGLPVMELDMTSFSETGYIGNNVSTIGTSLKDLAANVVLPDWYVKLRTGTTMAKEEKLYTRAEHEALLYKEKLAEMETEDHARKRDRAAKQAHGLKLTSMGILPDEATYLSIQRIYHLRAMILGYCSVNNIPYDDFDLRELELTPGKTVLGWAKQFLGIMESLLKSEFKTMADLDIETVVDLDVEEAVLLRPELMAELTGFMALGPILETYHENGLMLMASNPAAACVGGDNWYDAAFTFDSDSKNSNVPPGIEWRWFDDSRWITELAMRLVLDYDNLMDEFWSVAEFSDFATDSYWEYEIPEGEVEKKNIRTLSKSDMLKVSNCNGQDFVENFAVIFLDEFDKLAEGDRDVHSRVSRSGVQRSLLKPVEGGVYSGIDTTNILFVAAGSFAENPVTKLLPELQGRFPLRANLEPLDKDALMAICKLPIGEFHGMVKLLKAENVRVIYDHETYVYIAERTAFLNEVDNLGARRLASVVESIFQDALFEPTNYTQSGYDITGAKLREKAH